MFNNKFLKNDPLLEAVKGAQLEGEYRRQAEKIVNEEFGVYSRKAVIREQLAAYDAALEEVYAELKEGKKLDRDGDGDKDFADIMTARREKSGQSHSQAVAATKNKPYNMEEDATLKDVRDADAAQNPSGLAAQRNKSEDDALERAGKSLAKDIKEKKMWEGSEDTPSNVPPSSAAQQAAKKTTTPPSTPAPTKTKDLSSTFDSARGATGMQESLKKPDAKTAMKVIDRAQEHDDWEDSDYTRSNRLYNWKQKHLPGKRSRNQKDTGKAELPDYSPKDLGYGRTIKKSGQLTKATQKKTKDTIKDRLDKHTQPKHLPEEQINEIDYSPVKAAAGQDIGHKGKMFSKIANKVARKTGSLVRGKKVAGAMLAKLRAKHKNKQRPVSEDSSFKSAQVTESKKLGLGKSVNEQSPLTATREMPKTTSAPPIRSPITPMSAAAPEVRSPNAPDPAPAAGKKSFLGRLSDKIGSSISQFKDKISSLRGQPKPSTTNFNFGKTVPDTTMRFAGTPAPKAASIGSRMALGAGRALSAAAGPEGVAIGAAAPYAAAAMKQSYQKGHSSFTGGHTETPTDGKSFERMRQMSVPKPAAATPPAPGTAKPAAPPAKPAAPVAPVKQSFSQAYQAARQAATAAKQDPNKAQFKWTNKAGKEGTYQAAATKKDYVAPSKQIKTNIGAPEIKTTPETQTPAPAAQTPGPSTPSTASVKVDNERIKTLGNLGNANQQTKDIKFPLRSVDTNKAVSDNMSPEKSPATKQAASNYHFSNLGWRRYETIKGSAAPISVGEPPVTPPKDAETPASKYPQTRIGGQMAIQDLANKAPETPSSMTVNKDTSTDDIVKALSGKKQTNESEDKTDTQTQPREIGKYDFTKIMPDMTQDEIKKSKELTTTPKIRNINMRESVQVGSNKYRIV